MRVKRAKRKDYEVSVFIRLVILAIIVFCSYSWYDNYMIKSLQAFDNKYPLSEHCVKMLDVTQGTSNSFASKIVAIDKLKELYHISPLQLKEPVNELINLTEGGNEVSLQQTKFVFDMIDNELIKLHDTFM